MQKFTAFSAFHSEPLLPGQAVDEAMAKLVEPAPPASPRAGAAPSRKKGKAIAATSEEEEGEEESGAKASDGDDEATGSLEEEGEDDIEAFSQ